MKNAYGLVLGLFSLVFLIFIPTTLSLGVGEYVLDNVLAIVLMVLLYFLHGYFLFTPFGYFLSGLALVLHNLGMYGFYNVSPVFLQWDHITHFVGFFAVTFLLWGLFYEQFDKKFFPAAVFVILASLGVSVFIEFLEFFGFLFVGEGMGVFGQGLGDTATEIGSSEWFNTIFDLGYNLLGSVVATTIIWLIQRFSSHKTYKVR